MTGVLDSCVTGAGFMFSQRNGSQALSPWIHRNTRTIGIGGAIVLLFLVLVWVSRPAAPSGNAAVNGPSGILAADERSYDFGTISMAKGKVTRTFRLRNTGSTPVTIRRMSTSCMCTSATLVVGDRRRGPYGMPGHGYIPRIDQEIEAGSAASVDVTFDPAAHGPAGVGPIQRVVRIETVDGPELQLEIKAVVRP